MRAYIGALDLILFAALVGHDDDLDALGSTQKRYGIADRPRGHSATIPAHHNVVQPERRLYTSVHLTENVKLYERLGYKVDREAEVSPHLGVFVYMSKRLL